MPAKSTSKTKSPSRQVSWRTRLKPLIQEVVSAVDSLVGFVEMLDVDEQGSYVVRAGLDDRPTLEHEWGDVCTATNAARREILTTCPSRKGVVDKSRMAREQRKVWDALSLILWDQVNGHSVIKRLTPDKQDWIQAVARTRDNVPVGWRIVCAKAIKKLGAIRRQLAESFELTVVPRSVEQAPASATTRRTHRSSTSVMEYAHGEDFTWILWQGKNYPLAKGNQAESMKALWESWERGLRQDGCGLSEKTIGARCDSNNDNFRLAHVFRDHPLWKTVIKSVSKGVFALYAAE